MTHAKDGGEKPLASKIRVNLCSAHNRYAGSGLQAKRPISNLPIALAGAGIVAPIFGALFFLVMELTSDGRDIKSAIGFTALMFSISALCSWFLQRRYRTVHGLSWRITDMSKTSAALTVFRIPTDYMQALRAIASSFDDQSEVEFMSSLPRRSGHLALISLLAGLGVARSAYLLLRAETPHTLFAFICASISIVFLMAAVQLWKRVNTTLWATVLTIAMLVDFVIRMTLMSTSTVDPAAKVFLWFGAFLGLYVIISSIMIMTKRAK